MNDGNDKKGNIAADPHIEYIPQKVIQRFRPKCKETQAEKIMGLYHILLCRLPKDVLPRRYDLVAYSNDFGYERNGRVVSFGIVRVWSMT